MPIDSLNPKVNRKEEERNEKNIAAPLGEATAVPRDQHLLQTSPQSLYHGKSKATVAIQDLWWGTGGPNDHELTGRTEEAWGAPPPNKKLGVSEKMEPHI